MQGKILDFSIQESRGIITGDNGQRYEFAASEWKAPGMPERGMAVDFDVNAEHKAVGVYLSLQADTLSVNKKSGQHHYTHQTNKDLFYYAFQAFTTKFADFNGRARRMEYWGFRLVHFIFHFICACFVGLCMEISSDLGDIMGGLWFILLMICFIPDLAVSVRRLHDIGKSGWWMSPLVKSTILIFIFSIIVENDPSAEVPEISGAFVVLIWFIYSIILFVFFCQDSNPDDNQYGSNPKNTDV